MIVLKNLDELKIMDRANKIIRDLLEEILPMEIKPGVTTQYLDKIAEDYILSQGAKPGFKGYRVGPNVYPATLCTSLNEEVVHGIPSPKVILKEGDILSVDIGTIVEGYYGDSAKTFAVGTIDEKTDQLMKIGKESLYIGIEQAIAGNRIGDISNAIQKYVERYGFSVVRDYCGHGVGKYLHEDPQIPNFGPKNRGVKIENGMVLAIEPMVNRGTHKVKSLGDGWTVVTLDRKKSVHFEHSVAIVDGKAVILGRGEIA